MEDVSAKKQAAIAKAISDAGITDQNIANQIAKNEVTDPVLAAAYGAPKDPQLLSLISAVASGKKSNVNAIASALYVANITASSPDLVTSLATADITSPVLATGIANAIAAAGITSPLQMTALAVAETTNSATATQISAAITATGTTSQSIANAIAVGNITNPTQAISFSKIMNTAGSSVNPVSFSSTGIADPAVLGNFVDAMAMAGLGQSRTSTVNKFAEQVISQNLSSITDITSLIAPPPPVKSPTKSVASVSTTTTSKSSGNKDSKSVSVTTTVSTTTTSGGSSTTGTTDGTYSPQTLELVTGTCATNCGTSAF